MSTQPSKACGHCGTTSAELKQCSKCKEAYYCNRDCQVAAWPKHKQQCKATAAAGKEKEPKTFVMPTRPGQSNALGWGNQENFLESAKQSGLNVKATPVTKESWAAYMAKLEKFAVTGASEKELEELEEIMHGKRKP